MEGVTSSPGSTKSAGLPNITGDALWPLSGYLGVENTDVGSIAYFNGAFAASDKGNSVIASVAGYIGGKTKRSLSFDASKSNSIYGVSSTVQPASYTVLYIMKIKA